MRTAYEKALFRFNEKCCLPMANSTSDVDRALSFRSVSTQVLSPRQSLTSVFGMGTGGPSALIALTFGAPSGIRTRDPLIKSQLLYQLS